MFGGNKIKERRQQSQFPIIGVKKDEEDGVKNKFKLFLVMGIGMALLLVLSGCGNSTDSSNTTGQSAVSKETVFEFYDKVQLDQTKEQVDTELGVIPTESTQLEDSFVYVNEKTGFGVSVLFNENGLVMSKTLLYPDFEDIAFLTQKAVTLEQADSIPEGASDEEVKTILGGAGIEISATQIAFEDNKVSYIRLWVNQDGSRLQVVFLTDGTVGNVGFYD